MNRNFFNKARCSGAVCLCMMVVSPSLVAGPPQTKASEEKAVAQIRARVAEADKQEKTYRTVERSIEGYSTEGGILTGWFRGNELVKMTARFFGESGKSSDEFYFLNGSPVFALRTGFGYDSLLSGKVVRQEQTRFYWSSGRLIRVLDDKKHSLNVDSPETRKQAQELMELLPKFTALLRNPKGAKVPPDDVR